MPSRKRIVPDVRSQSLPLMPHHPASVPRCLAIVAGPIVAAKVLTSVALMEVGRPLYLPS